MKILFYLHKYPSYGGIENVTTYLANYFVNNQNEVSIYSFVGVDHDLLLKKLDSRICYCQATNTDVYDSAANYEQLKDLIAKKKVQYVIFQDSYAPVDSLLKKMRMDGVKIKIITVEHNTPDAFLKALMYERPSSVIERIKRKILYPWYYSKLFCLIRRRHKRIYRYSDRYVLLTQKFETTFKKITGIKHPKKLLAIHNPITIETPEKINWGEKRKICLFPARLVGQKGIHLLMSIWRKIEAKSTDLDLMIVGDGPERSFIENSIKTYGLKHVILEGFQSEMQPYYKKASILIATSIYEGWPLTLTESMSYGCIPVVFDSYLAASEIVENDYSGLVIPAFDIDMYVKKIILLMTNFGKRKLLSQNALVSSERFKIESIGMQWDKMLNDVLYENDNENDF